MITIRKLAYEIIRLESAASLAKGLFIEEREVDESLQSSDQALVVSYVSLLCRQALNKLITPKIYQNLNEDDRGGLALMTAMYTVTVEGDSPNKYITLPEFYIALPFNKGLHGVAPVEDPTNFFIPRHNPSVSFSLPCSDLDPDQSSYWTMGLKVYFDGDFEYNKVLLYLLVGAPDTVGVDDSLPMYADMQADLIAMVRQMIQNPIIENKVLDKQGVDLRLR